MGAHYQHIGCAVHRDHGSTEVIFCTLYQRMSIQEALMSRWVALVYRAD
jgi:hypothetical protein